MPVIRNPGQPAPAAPPSDDHPKQDGNLAGQAGETVFQDPPPDHSTAHSQLEPPVPGWLESLEKRLVQQIKSLEAATDAQNRQTADIHRSGSYRVDMIEDVLAKLEEAGRSRYDAITYRFEGLQEEMGLHREILHRMETIEQRLAETEGTHRQTLEALGGQLEDIEKKLEISAKNAEESTRLTQTRVLRGLEAVDDRIAQRHDALHDFTEKMYRTVQDDLNSLESRTAETISLSEAVLVRAVERLQDSLQGELSAVTLALQEVRTEIRDGTELRQAAFLETLEAVENRVLDALAGSLHELKSTGSSVGSMAESLKQMRTEGRETAGQSERRILQFVDALESRFLQAVADLNTGFSEERTVAKFEIQQRIKQGVTDPLKNLALMLNRQLNEIQASTDRTLDTLADADVMIRLDSADPRVDRARRHRSNLGDLSSPSRPEPASPEE